MNVQALLSGNKISEERAKSNCFCPYEQIVSLLATEEMLQHDSDP